MNFLSIFKTKTSAHVKPPSPSNKDKKTPQQEKIQNKFSVAIMQTHQSDQLNREVDLVVKKIELQQQRTTLEQQKTGTTQTINTADNEIGAAKTRLQTIRQETIKGIDQRIAFLAKKQQSYSLLPNSNNEILESIKSLTSQFNGLRTRCESGEDIANDYKVGCQNAQALMLQMQQMKT